MSKQAKARRLTGIEAMAKVRTLRTSARKLMVEVFNLAGDQDELVSKYRKLLAGALY